MKPISIFAAVTLSLCFYPLAQADWQAQVKTEVTGKQQIAPIDGTMRVGKDGVRIDVSTPADLSMIVQTKKKKAFNLIHAAKIVMESDLTQYENNIPACSTSDPEACYKKLGLKKTGTEMIDGKKCEVIEGEIKESKTKIWHPVGQKEGPPLRSVVFLKEGGRVESNFSNVQIKSIPGSVFTVPAEYKAAGKIEDLMKNIPGFSH
jgi:hypothetical protein